MPVGRKDFLCKVLIDLPSVPVGSKGLHICVVNCLWQKGLPVFVNGGDILVGRKNFI